MALKDLFVMVEPPKGEVTIVFLAVTESEALTKVAQLARSFKRGTDVTVRDGKDKMTFRVK